MIQERIILNEERNVTLDAYIQSVREEWKNIQKRPAVLVLPGGGYSMCSDREAEPVAIAYFQAGYQAFVLRYSLGADANWPNPLEDYEQAMTLIREKSDEWNVYPDKVAVVGFSAGGHLASAAATMAVNKPNAAILVYPAIGEQTLRACIRETTVPFPNTAKAVNRETAPCFIVSARNDNVALVENSIEFINALTQYHISYESHIYAYGVHGFTTALSWIEPSLSKCCNRLPHWLADSMKWLTDMFGDFNPHGGMTEPVCPPRLYMADDLEYLSIECTLGCIMNHEESASLVKKKIPMFHTLIPNEDFLAGISKMELRIVAALAGMSKEEMEQLDQELRKIENRK